MVLFLKFHSFLSCKYFLADDIFLSLQFWPAQIARAGCDWEREWKIATTHFTTANSISTCLNCRGSRKFQKSPKIKPFGRAYCGRGKAALTTEEMQGVVSRSGARSSTGCRRCPGCAREGPGRARRPQGSAGRAGPAPRRPQPGPRPSERWKGCNDAEQRAEQCGAQPCGPRGQGRSGGGGNPSAAAEIRDLDGSSTAQPAGSLRSVPWGDANVSLAIACYKPRQKNISGMREHMFFWRK